MEIVKKINNGNKKIHLNMIQDFHESCSGSSLQLPDFPIFASRLQHIQQRMVDWRPIRVKGLFTRPYRDPLPYFAFWFATWLGFIGVVGVFLGAIQVAFAVLSWKLTK
jgi:hypothetical protein